MLPRPTTAQLGGVNMDPFETTVVAPLIVGLFLLLFQHWLKSGKK